MAVQMDGKGRLRWVVVLTAVGSFMAALDTLVVASALSTIKRDLDASLTDLEWTINAYNLSFAVLLAPAAVLGAVAGSRLPIRRPGVPDIATLDANDGRQAVAA